MRTSLFAALALSVAASLSPPDAAEACGWTEPLPPAMFVVATHQHRTFVLVDGNVPAYRVLDWRRETTSFDRAVIAPADAPAAARTFTLVGSARTRVTATSRAAYLDHLSETSMPMTGLEIDPRGGSISIAIEGSHAAAWAASRRIRTTPDAEAWVRNPPFTPAPDPDVIEVGRVAGTDLETLTTMSTGGQRTTYIRYGTETWGGGWPGSPVGMVTVDGTRYLALVDNGVVRPVSLR